MPLRQSAADRAILSLASRQHRVVSRTQLLAAGISSETIARRTRSGLLRPIHRGVYFVGAGITPRASAMAAVLACGGRAWTSHWMAEVLWQSSSVVPDEIDVIFPGGGRRRPGIRIHRIAPRPEEVTVLEGIPITTQARTLLDIAATVPAGEFDRAVVEALASRRTRREELLELLKAHPRHAGVTRLRAVLRTDEPAAQSRMERLLLAMVAEAGLPRPEVNVYVEGYRVDFLWRAERVVVETDGFAYHSTAARFETDRRRDRVVAAAGYRTMRVTWRQLRNERVAFAVQLARVLESARASLPTSPAPNVAPAE